MTLKKRSVTIGGHATSIALEPAFWSALEAFAQEHGQSLNALITKIDAERGQGSNNLASNLRLHILEDLQQKIQVDDVLESVHKQIEQAGKLGFIWEDYAGVIAKLQEECDELNEALKKASMEAVEDEMGDCFFTLISLCHMVGLKSKACLDHANKKFKRRFQRLIALSEAQGQKIEQLSLNQLEAYWQQVKQEELAR